MPLLQLYISRVIQIFPDERLQGQKKFRKSITQGAITVPQILKMTICLPPFLNSSELHLLPSKIIYRVLFYSQRCELQAHSRFPCGQLPDNTTSPE